MSTPLERAAKLKTAGRPFEARRRLREALASADVRDAHRIRARLKALDADLEPRVGRAWFPVDTAQGFLRGGLVRVEVCAPAAHLRGESAPQPQFANALAGAIRHAGTNALGLRVSIWPSSAEVLIEGESFELAVAVAAWSWLVGASVPANTGFTGMLDHDAVVTPRALETKRSVLQSEWGADARLLTGPTHDPIGLGAATLGAVLDGIAPRHGVPLVALQAAMDSAFGQRDFRGAVGHAARLLERATRLYTHAQLFRAATLAAHAYAHLGEHDLALEQWARAADWADGAAADDRAEAASIMGILYLDADRIEDGVALVQSHLARPPGQVLPWALTQLHGTAARLASALGDHRAAVEHGRTALDHAPVYERARNLNDLTLWHLRAGDLDAARQMGEDAEEALLDARAVNPKNAAVTAEFLALTRARLSVARGAPHAARTWLGQITSPDIALRLGVAEVRVQLGDSPVAELGVIDAGENLAPGAPVSVVSRIRARIELRRPEPDLARVAEWVGEPVADPEALLARLDQRLPY